MLKKVLSALGIGLLWLFAFSLPVGRGKQLFDVLHFYIVDTKPVHWAVKMFDNGVETTTETAKQTADEIVRRVDGTLSKATESTQRAE